MSKEICTVCHGSREVPYVGAWTTGYDTQPCYHCNGSGDEPEEKTQVEEPVAEKDCTVCNGRGRVPKQEIRLFEDSVCPHCKGTKKEPA